MRTIIGVDEAGRGPLAGPVVVGVVAAPEEFDFFSVFPKLNDSKKLSEKRREEIFETLCQLQKEGIIQFCVKSVDAATIDRSGISPAVRSCVGAGVKALAKDTSVKVFLDGLLKAPDEYEQETVEGGDATIPVIMLASVAAKVSRDRLMKQLAATYPQYGFEKHKGYGTRAHYEMIKMHGPCAIHRRSFLHL